MKYIQTNDSVTAHTPKGPLTINASHPRFREVCVALATGDFTGAIEMMSIRSAITKWSEGGFVLEGDKITFRGESLPSDLAERIIGLFKEGNHTFQAFANFWARLQKNPSYRSVNQLWAFIKAKNIPLSPEGHFYAYKAINDDWTDCHSRQVLNRPGTLIHMDRNKISDDPDLACHFGYHVGNRDFVANNYSGRKVVICLIDPADVVCVPKDSSGGKMRVCRYLVLGERDRDLPNGLWDHVTQWKGYLKTKAPDVSLENFNGVERDLVAADHLTHERVEIQMPPPPTPVDVEIEDDDGLDPDENETEYSEDDIPGSEDSVEMPESTEDEPTAAPIKTLNWGDDLKGLDLKALRKLASGLKIPKAGKLGAGQLRTAIGLAKAQVELVTKAEAESAPAVPDERKVAIGVDWGSAEGSVPITLVNAGPNGTIESLDTLNREKLREIAKGLGIKGCMGMSPAELRLSIRGVPSVRRYALPTPVQDSELTHAQALARIASNRHWDGDFDTKAIAEAAAKTGKKFKAIIIDDEDPLGRALPDSLVGPDAEHTVVTVQDSRFGYGYLSDATLEDLQGMAHDISGWETMSEDELRTAVRKLYDGAAPHGAVSGRALTATPNQANEPEELHPAVQLSKDLEPGFARSVLPSRKVSDLTGLSREKLRVIAKELEIKGCMGMSPDALRAAITKAQG